MPTAHLPRRHSPSGTTSGSSLFTVAGPRRTHTGFPFKPRLGRHRLVPLYHDSSYLLPAPRRSLRRVTDAPQCACPRAIQRKTHERPFWGEDHAVLDVEIQRLLALAGDTSASLALSNLIGKSCDKPFVFGLGANCSAQVSIAKALVIGAVAQDNFVAADQTLPEWLAIDRAGQA
jgi:hypothetical protein